MAFEAKECLYPAIIIYSLVNHWDVKMQELAKERNYLEHHNGPF